MDTINLMKELEKIDNIISHNRVSFCDSSKEIINKKNMLLKRIDENSKHKQIIFNQIIKITELITKEKNQNIIRDLRITMHDLNTMYDKL